MVWPSWLDNVLAKSVEKSHGSEPETLSQHTWSVLERFAELTRLRPDLPAQIGEPRLWHRLFWGILLHDFGKAAAGFQKVLRKEAERWPQRHEVLSLAFVDWLFPDSFSPDRLWIIAVIASHHRDVSYLEDLYPDGLDEEDDVIPSLLSDIPDTSLQGIWRWLSECPRSWVNALRLDNAGIEFPTVLPQAEALAHFRKNSPASVHRALKEYQQWAQTLRDNPANPIVTATILLRGHVLSSDHLASAHVGELPQSQLAGPDKLLQRWRITPDQLYAHQCACLSTHGSAVLMAPTGSGKTEAALLWAVTQATSMHPVPRLYYTLPYQASMNAMCVRLDDKDTGAFPGQVGLEHGRSTLAYYRRLLQEKDYSLERAAREARVSSDLAKLSYFPVRVLSPYQVLKGPYRLKGYETLLTDCFDATFILDEVHTYDAKRLALILCTVKHLREQYGARFFVMSATLPTLLQNRLAEALGDYIPLQAGPDLYAQFRRHALIFKKGDLLESGALDRIAKVARSGQSVLVCCNIVKRAQKAYEELGKRLEGSIKVELLHGRFNARDRLAKEQLVRDAVGSRSGQRKAIVLVATQVVEVSLDIDLDVIYTDPAPLEALLQRFGRINRRRLKECAPVCVFREPSDGQRIYEPKLVQAALDVLEENEGRLIDEAQVSTWLDQVYQGQIATEWNETYQSAYIEFSQSILSKLRAFYSADRDLEDQFYKTFDSIEVLPSCFSDEYREALDKNPLEASQLLVPIRWGQFSQLKQKGLTREGEEGWPKMVDAAYNTELGLQLG